MLKSEPRGEGGFSGPVEGLLTEPPGLVCFGAPGGPF